MLVLSAASFDESEKLIRFMSKRDFSACPSTVKAEPKNEEARKPKRIWAIIHQSRLQSIVVASKTELETTPTLHL